MSEYDVIIIGAGLAGLTAGAKLSKEGKKVLLIEHHHTVGGCATIFKRREFQFEVGLHEMNGLANDDDSKIKIFKELGVFDHVEFIRVPEFFRFRHGDFDFVMPEGLEEAKWALVSKFPKEEMKIEHFFQEMKDIQAFKKKTLFKRQKSTVGEVMDEYFSNEEIKLTLCANIAYYHDNPYQLSFIYFSLAQLSYIEGGGWYIKGGSLQLSQYLADYIYKNNGEIILKYEVTEILLDDQNKTAIGVKYKRTKRKNPEILDAYAKIIVSNAAIPNVTNFLIPSLKNTEFTKKVSSQTLPCSLLSIYLAFSDHKFNNKHYSTFYCGKNTSSLKTMHENEVAGDYNNKGFVFVDYGILGEPPTGVICAIDYLKNWENLEKQEYKKKKEEIIEIFIESLNEKIPGIREKIVYSELATPKTIVKYTKNPSGVIYGFAQTPEMIGPKRLEVTKPPIKNLYFASAWGYPGGGYSGAISSGYQTATMLLKRH
ncbi:MAG: phytoene desaturase family protein [Candidatus Hodarchaeales archaeon]|jgi:phytoene dehydrogenase-like protein